MTDMLHKITKAWTRAWAGGDFSVFESIVAPDYKRHSKSGDESLEEVAEQARVQHEAFSDYEMNVLTAIEGDNVVAVHWQSSGTHTGEFMGVPPTGKRVTVTGASFIKHKDGLITEESVVWDPRDMLSSMSIWHLGDQRSSRRKAADGGH